MHYFKVIILQLKLKKKKRPRIAQKKKKRESYSLDNKTRIYNMLPIKDPLQGERYTQIESEGMGMEKDIFISCEWKQESNSSNIHIR